jgi:hypothetical protein
MDQSNGIRKLMIAHNNNNINRPKIVKKIIMLAKERLTRKIKVSVLKVGKLIITLKRVNIHHFSDISKTQQ